MEPSPAPTKWAAKQLGLCGDALRLPITPLTADGQTVVGQALRDAGLL
jgi:4-hydroxy-tetrahydrodipicolinate synthase